MSKNNILNGKTISSIINIIVTIIICNDILRIKIGTDIINTGIYIVLCILLVVRIIISRTFKIRKICAIWTAFYIIILFSSIKYNIALSGVHFRWLAVILFLDFAASMKKDIAINCCNIIFVYSLFQAFGVYLQLIFPRIHSILFELLNVVFDLREANQSYQLISELGYYRGFCIYPGYTAIYIVNGLILLGLYKERISNIKYYIIMSLLFIALFLTGKRAHVIAMVIAFSFVYVVCSNDIITNLRRVFISVLIVFFIYEGGKVVYKYSPNIPGISRTLELIYGYNANLNKLTSGRIYLWERAMSYFQESESLGIGWNQYIQKQGMLVHNSYLQVLCELGIIGSVCFCGALLYTLIIFIMIYTKKRSTVCELSCEDKTFVKISILYQVYFIIYSFTGNTLWDPTVYYFYFFLIVLNYCHIDKKVKLGRTIRIRR